VTVTISFQLDLDFLPAKPQMLVDSVLATSSLR